MKKETRETERDQRAAESREDKDPGFHRRISRRTLLRAMATSGVIGSSLPLLEGWAASPPARDSKTSTGAAPKKGGILRYGLSTDPPHLDPHVDSGGASSLVKGTIYSLLVRLNARMEILPDLAESWERPDDTVGFRLRDHP